MCWSSATQRCKSRADDYISGTVQRINMGLAPLWCWGPAHSTDIWIAALECTCECLRQNTAKFHSPTRSDTDLETLVDIRWYSLVLESATETKSEPAAEGSWGFLKMSEKVPSEKNQGASYDNTICPIIPSSENEFWLAVVQNQATENHQTFNSKCDGSVVPTEGPTHFR